VGGARVFSTLALGTLRRWIPELKMALEGQFPPLPAKPIASALGVVAVLSRQIAEIDQHL
jgi:hypothetical protein